MSDFVICLNLRFHYLPLPQALEAVSARGGIDSFDVVLMDLHMPLMGGMEAVAELQQRYPNRWVAHTHAWQEC